MSEDRWDRAECPWLTLRDAWLGVCLVWDLLLTCMGFDGTKKEDRRWQDN